MYCPRCGQQQVSDEMRYCSRCGLPISGLSQWVSSGATSDKQQQTGGLLPSPRRRAIRRAAKLMFASGVLFLACAAFSIAIDEGAPVILPVILFFISVIMMLYARLFGDPTPQRAPIPAVAQRVNETALPPASHLPTYDTVAQQIRTRELAEPPSVTENTTKLLDIE